MLGPTRGRPTPILIALGDRGRLYGHTVIEVRFVRRFLGDGRKELVVLVDEQMIPAQNVAWQPPMLDGRIVGVGYENRLEAPVAVQTHLKFCYSYRSFRHSGRSPVLGGTWL